MMENKVPSTQVNITLQH